MNDLQRFLVTDHIERLERDAEGLRAERAAGPSRRRRLLAARGRLGTLLVALGRGIAGGVEPAPTTVGDVPRNGVAARAAEPPLPGVTPCPDDAVPLPRAA